MWGINYESLTKFGLSVSIGFLVASLVLHIAEINVFSARLDNLEKEQFYWLESGSNQTVREMALNSLKQRKDAATLQVHAVGKLSNQLMWSGFALLLISLAVWVAEEIQKKKNTPKDPKNFKQLLKRIVNDPDYPHYEFYGYLEKFVPSVPLRKNLFDNNFFVDLSAERDMTKYTVGPAGIALVSAWENEEISRSVHKLTIFVILLTVIQVILTILK